MASATVSEIGSRVGVPVGTPPRNGLVPVVVLAVVVDRDPPDEVRDCAVVGRANSR
jgi:hypothetical protein